MGHPQAARSQLPFPPHLSMLFAVLRSADKHLDQVIVQAVKQLALKRPLELRVFEIARVQIVIVSMNFGFDESRAKYDFDALSFHPRTERDQRMLIELELIEYLRQVVRGHPAILLSDGSAQLMRR